MRLNKGLKFRAPFTALVAALLASTGQASTVDWYGGAGNWSDASRWSGYALPGANDDVKLGWPYPNGADVFLSYSYPSYITFTEIASLAIGSHSRLQIYGTTLQIGGEIVNDGALVLGRSYSTPSILRIGPNTTLSGAGTLTLNYNTFLDLNASTLTIGSAQTVRGAGDIGNGNLINRGHLIAEGSLSFYPGANSIDNTAGRITVGSGSVLSAMRTHFTGGLISTTSGGGIYGGVGPASAVFSNVTFEGDARLGGSLTLDAAINKGVLRVSSTAATATIKGAVVNDGDIHVTTTLAVEGNTSLSGNGTVRLVRDTFGIPFPTIGNIDVAANSTLTIDENQTVLGSGRFRGAANSHIINKGSILVDGVMYAYLQDGAFDNRAGHITVTAGATFGSTGTLVLGDASTLTFEIGSSASNHGALYVASTIPQALDGTLQLNIGYGAQVGDSFSLAKYAGGVTGSFDQIIAAGYSVSASFNGGDLVVTVTGISPVPEPASWMMAGVGLLLIGRRLRTRG